MASIQRTCLLQGAFALICLLVLSTQAGAALDTSGPIICAFTHGFECDDQDGCQATTPETLGLPVFVKLDLANNRVSATTGAPQTGNKRETAIGGVHEADGKLFLQGIERRGWSTVIDKETGQMTLAASSDNEAVVFFGRCTAP